MSHVYKKVPTAPVEKQYSPADLVRAYGDNWNCYLDESIRGRTALALKDNRQDQREAFLMSYMEKGILPRVDVV